LAESNGLIIINNILNSNVLGSSGSTLHLFSWHLVYKKITGREMKCNAALPSNITPSNTPYSNTAKVIAAFSNTLPISLPVFILRLYNNQIK
jgi:hypothetical protein